MKAKSFACEEVMSRDDREGRVDPVTEAGGPPVGLLPHSLSLASWRAEVRGALTVVRTVQPASFVGTATSTLCC